MADSPDLQENLVPSSTIDEGSPHEVIKNKKEIERLASRTPLRTILFLMIGPIMSQVTGSLYGVINQIWVSRKIGEIGMAAIGIEITLEGFGRAFGYFMMIAASTQISALFGQGKAEEATQVLCDILRCAVICGIIVPIVLLPGHHAMCMWFGASEETTALGYRYLAPLCYGSVLTTVSLAFQGFLQAEGRTLLLGALDVAALLIGCLVTTPLCLYVFHTNVEGAGIATIIGDGGIGTILMICYFRGVFGLKPKLNQLLKPFSKHTWQALLVGSSQLFANLSGALPGIPIRNLIGQSTGPGKPYDLAMDGFNVLCRFYNIVIAILNAVCTGYIPAASYAYAAQNWRRFLKLSFHASWLAFAWSAFMNVWSWAIPRQIAMVFGEGEEYVTIAAGMVKGSFALGFLIFFRYNAQALLQAMQFGTRAIILSVMCQFLSNLAFGYLLFYTDKHNVVRLMWLYSWAHLFGFVVGLLFIVGPLRRVIKDAKEQTVPEIVNLDDLEEIEAPTDRPNDSALTAQSEMNLNAGIPTNLGKEENDSLGHIKGVEFKVEDSSNGSRSQNSEENSENNTELHNIAEL